LKTSFNTLVSEIRFVKNVLEIFFLRSVKVQRSKRTINILKVQHLKRCVYYICDKHAISKSTLTYVEVCFKKAKRSGVLECKGCEFNASIKYSNKHFFRHKPSTKKMKPFRDNKYLLKIVYKYEKLWRVQVMNQCAKNSNRFFLFILSHFYVNLKIYKALKTLCIS